MTKRILSKSKTVDIELADNIIRKVTLYEVRPFDLVKAFQEHGNDNAEVVNRLLELCSDLKTDDLKEFYPSDLEKIWEAFESINAPFFKTLTKTGLREKIKEAVQGYLTKTADRIGKAFSSQFQGLSVPGIQKPDITDLPLS